MVPALRSPFSELDDLRRDMDRLFTRLTRDFFPSTFEQDWLPALDLADTGENLIAEIEVPGMDPKDINITVTGEVLTISGERKRPEGDKDHTYHLEERSYGKFSRSIRLPAGVDPDQVEAAYKDGILRVSLRKAEHARSKRIEVQAA